MNRYPNQLSKYGHIETIWHEQDSMLHIELDDFTRELLVIAVFDMLFYF